MSEASIRSLGIKLMDSGVPEKITLAYMMGAYVIGEDAHGKTGIPVVIVTPDGEGNVGAAGLTGDPQQTIALLLNGVCGTAVQALGLDLPTVQRLLADAWGERERGMGDVARHGTTRRRPSTRRGRGKR